MYILADRVVSIEDEPSIINRVVYESRNKARRAKRSLLKANSKAYENTYKVVIFKLVEVR